MLCYYSTVITPRQLYFSHFTRFLLPDPPSPVTAAKCSVAFARWSSSSPWTLAPPGCAPSPLTGRPARSRAPTANSPSSSPSPVWVEHDAAEIADLAVATLREVAAHVHDHGHKVAAIGVTNQRETTVAFDRETGHLVHRAIVWQDHRSAPYCEQLERGGHGGVVRTTTGLVLDSYFSATKMKWLLEAGHLDAATSPSLCTIDTWLLWWLSGASDGGVYLTEPSNASRTC